MVSVWGAWPPTKSSGDVHFRRNCVNSRTLQTLYDFQSAGAFVKAEIRCAGKNITDANRADFVSCYRFHLNNSVRSLHHLITNQFDRCQAS